MLSHNRAIPVAKRERSLILVLRMPRSAQDAKDSLALLEAACNLVDALEMGHAKVTNTTLAKLRNTRNTVDKELEEEATKYQKEEEEEAKAEAKKKAEKEKLEKLSPAEQEKVSISCRNHLYRMLITSLR
jgi:septal ring factor EnvC (AmiA/AmiB activator)